MGEDKLETVFFGLFCHYPSDPESLHIFTFKFFKKQDPCILYKFKEYFDSKSFFANDSLGNFTDF